MRRSRQSRPCSRDNSHSLATVCAKKAASLWRAIVGLPQDDEGGATPGLRPRVGQGQRCAQPPMSHLALARSI